jgi:hypothetical protein
MPPLLYTSADVPFPGELSHDQAMSVLRDLSASASRR